MSWTWEPLYEVHLLILYFQYKLCWIIEFEEKQIWVLVVKNVHTLLISYKTTKVKKCLSIKYSPSERMGKKKRRHFGYSERNMYVLHYFLSKYIYSLKRINAVATTFAAFLHSPHDWLWLQTWFYFGVLVNVDVWTLMTFSSSLTFINLFPSYFVALKVMQTNQRTTMKGSRRFPFLQLDWNYQLIKQTPNPNHLLLWILLWMSPSGNESEPIFSLRVEFLFPFSFKLVWSSTVWLRGVSCKISSSALCISAFRLETFILSWKTPAWGVIKGDLCQ